MSRGLLSGWGRTAPSAADVVVPLTRAEVVRAMADALPRGEIARGLGRAYGDAAQNSGGRVVDCTSVRGLLDFDDVTGEARVLGGTSIDELLRALVPRGWFVPVTPGTRFVTVGGAIASDVHGKNHHVAGSFSDHVQSLRLMLASGEVVDVSRSAETIGYRPAYSLRDGLAATWRYFLDHHRQRVS